jgi:uncharacterized protein YjbJ (UPF0337 family)
MRELGDAQRYLIEEFVEDWREGHMSRRDMVRRVVYLTGGVASAATVLVSMGCGPAAAPTAAPAAAPTAAERAAEPKVPCCSSSCDSFSSPFLSSCWFSSAIFLLLSAPALRAGAAASAPPSPRRRGETIRCSTAPCTFAGRRIGHGCAERRRNGVNRVGDRTQRLKGKANEAAGKKKGAFGYETGNAKTEAKGAAQTVKGKAQQAAGKARSTAKKKTR